MSTNNISSLLLSLILFDPFNSITMIRYDLRVAANVSLKVYDILGKEVATLVNEYKSAGRYEDAWDAGNLASGIYFYTIRSGNFLETKKMTLLR